MLFLSSIICSEAQKQLKETNLKVDVSSGSIESVENVREVEDVGGECNSLKKMKLCVEFFVFILERVRFLLVA